MDEVQIQSFKPGELTPDLALEIAKEFAQEYLLSYEAVTAVHVDRRHIHTHIIFNSVNAGTGEKYHSSAQAYYGQIRAASDRLCREHGLSVIMTGQGINGALQAIGRALLMRHLSVISFALIEPMIFPVIMGKLSIAIPSLPRCARCAACR